MKTLSLQKLKTKPKIVEHILWDWMPQKASENSAIPKLQNLADLLQFRKDTEESVGYFFYVDVWEGIPQLLLKQQGKRVSEVIGRIEEIPATLLQEVIEEEEEHSQITGEYPLTKNLQTWLKQQLQEG